jgi:hypothetical protein
MLFKKTLIEEQIEKYIASSTFLFYFCKLQIRI